MTKRVGLLALGVAIVAIALAGCLQSPETGRVPYPAIGASATWIGQGRVSTMAPTGTMLVDSPSGDSIIRLDGDRSLSVTVEPRQTRWDLYQDRHRVVPFNWTFFNGNRSWPVETAYRSAATGEQVSEVEIQSRRSDDGTLASSYRSGWVSRGAASNLGSSLFWGLELKEGRTFTRNLTRTSPNVSVQREPVTLRFEIGAPQTIQGRTAYRIVATNPETLNNPEAQGHWRELTFWVSPDTPFVVRRQGTYAVPHLSGSPWSGTAELASYEPGNETVPMNTSNRSYVWRPQSINLTRWKGFRPPGNGSSFAAFSMKRALEILGERDTTYIRYRAEHPNSTIGHATYRDRDGEPTWRFRLNEPDEEQGLKASVTMSNGPSPLRYETSAQMLPSPENPWIPPDAYDRFISVDNCWRLWNRMTGGQVEWTVFVVKMKPPGKCGFLPGGGATAAGLVFTIRYDGAYLVGEIPIWPRR